MKKHKFHSTHIELFDDGSASIHHMHEEGPHKDIKHAGLDLDDVHDSIQRHLNPDDSESAAEAAEERVHPGIHSEIAKMGYPEK